MSLDYAFDVAYQYAMEHVHFNPKWDANKFDSTMVREPFRSGSLGYSSSPDLKTRYVFIGTAIGNAVIVQEHDTRAKYTNQYRYYVCIPRELEMLLGVQSWCGFTDMATFRLFFDPILKTTVSNHLEHLFRAYDATKEPIGT